MTRWKNLHIQKSGKALVDRLYHWPISNQYWTMGRNHSTMTPADLIVLELHGSINGPLMFQIYRQVSNISRTLVGNKVVDHSDVVGASPVGAAPTTSSFSTEHMASLDWAKTTARWDEKHLSFAIWRDLY